MNFRQIMSAIKVTSRILFLNTFSFHSLFRQNKINLFVVGATSPLVEEEIHIQDEVMTALGAIIDESFTPLGNKAIKHSFLFSFIEIQQYTAKNV